MKYRLSLEASEVAVLFCCLLYLALRIDLIKALGVVVNSRLTVADHVDSTIAACVKSLYALKVLRSHGMPTLALHTVFQAVVLSKLIYCSCAWYGFCTAKE